MYLGDLGLPLISLHPGSFKFHKELHSHAEESCLIFRNRDGLLQGSFAAAEPDNTTSTFTTDFLAFRMFYLDEKTVENLKFTGHRSLNYSKDMVCFFSMWKTVLKFRTVIQTADIFLSWIILLKHSQPHSVNLRIPGTSLETYKIRFISPLQCGNKVEERE